MNFADTYYCITGIAHIKGLDFFDRVMPKKRVLSLFSACNKTKSFKWVEKNFINWIICIAGREIRKNKALCVPECKEKCEYRHSYESPKLQQNALRIEIITPSDRCGWNLKHGRIGGRPDDYYPCWMG